MDEVTAPNTPPPETPAAAPDQKSDLQARIDAIYGQAKQAQETASQVSEENAALRARLLAAEEKLTVTKQAASSSLPPDPGHSSRVEGAPAGRDELTDIRSQLAALNQRLERQTLEEQQFKAVQKARQIIPGLAAGDDQLAKAAAEIFAGDEMLRKHPQGPILAAALAASLSRPGAPATAKDKAGAFVPPSSASSAMEAGATQKQIEPTEAAVNDLRIKMRESGGSQYWAQYKNLQFKLGELKKQKG